MDMKLKAKMLQMLRDEMRSESKEEMNEKIHEHMIPEDGVKATILASDEEGLIEGVKQLPKIIDKAEEYMKMREEDEKKKK